MVISNALEIFGYSLNDKFGGSRAVLGGKPRESVFVAFFTIAALTCRNNVRDRIRAACIYWYKVLLMQWRIGYATISARIIEIFESVPPVGMSKSGQKSFLFGSPALLFNTMFGFSVILTFLLIPLHLIKIVFLPTRRTFFSPNFIFVIPLTRTHFGFFSMIGLILSFSAANFFQIAITITFDVFLYAFFMALVVLSFQIQRLLVIFCSPLKRAFVITSSAIMRQPASLTTMKVFKSRGKIRVAFSAAFNRRRQIYHKHSLLLSRKVMSEGSASACYSGATLSDINIVTQIRTNVSEGANRNEFIHV